MNTEAAAADIGHNEPPDPATILRDNLAEKHGDLAKRRDELLAACERVPETIDSDDAAGRVGDFLKQLGAAAKASEAARVAEKEPHLAAGRVVDGFFKAITDPLTKAKKGIEARLTTYLRQKEAEERRRREEEERLLREEAERKAREAAAAADAAQDDDSLDAAIDAEAAAKQAEADAARAQKEADAKAAELSRTRGDYGSVGSLRTHWTFKDIDRKALDLEALREHFGMDALEKAIRSYIAAGGRELKGVTIYEETSAVVR